MIAPFIRYDAIQRGCDASTFICFASDLQLPVQPPCLISTSLGNGMPLILEHANEQEWHYRQGCGGFKVVIFND